MAYQVQTSLFASHETHPVCEPEVIYVPNFVEDHLYWFEHLRFTLNWNSQFKSRKTVSFGISYNSRHGNKRKVELPKFLDPACKNIFKKFQYSPNNCLMNYYPDGSNYISFHSDQIDEMNSETGVTIISLGAVRNMVLRKIDNHNIKYFYPLQPGSAFFIKDGLHTQWQHGILKEPAKGPRISLSFRSLLD